MVNFAFPEETYEGESLGSGIYGINYTGTLGNTTGKVYTTTTGEQISAEFLDELTDRLNYYADEIEESFQDGYSGLFGSIAKGIKKGIGAVKKLPVVGGAVNLALKNKGLARMIPGVGNVVNAVDMIGKFGSKVPGINKTVQQAAAVGVPGGIGKLISKYRSNMGKYFNKAKTQLKNAKMYKNKYLAQKKARDEQLKNAKMYKNKYLTQLKNAKHYKKARNEQLKNAKMYKNKYLTQLKNAKHYKKAFLKYKKLYSLFTQYYKTRFNIGKYKFLVGRLGIYRLYSGNRKRKVSGKYLRAVVRKVYHTSKVDKRVKRYNKSVSRYKKAIAKLL